MFKEPRLRLLARLAPAAFDHVHHKRPRRPAKTDEGNLPRKTLPRKRERLEYVPQLFPYVHLARQLLEVLGCVQRVGEVRAWVHDHIHTHGLRHDEDVGEDDGCIEQAGVPPDGLHGDLGCEMRRTAYLEKFVAFTGFSELLGWFGLGVDGMGHLDAYLGDISLLDASPIRVRVLSARRVLHGGADRSSEVGTLVPFQISEGEMILCTRKKLSENVVVCDANIEGASVSADDLLKFES